MFSINIYLRFALMGVSLLGGIALSIAFGFWYAFPLFLVFLVLLVGYLLLGTVQSTALVMRGGDLVAAENRLS